MQPGVCMIDCNWDGRNPPRTPCIHGLDISGQAGQLQLARDQSTLVQCQHQITFDLVK